MRLRGKIEKPLIDQIEAMVKELTFEQQELLTKFTHFHRVMLEPWRNTEEKLRYWLSIHPGCAGTHERIADDIGVCRETVTRTLDHAYKTYTENGWILGCRSDG
jgi:hypothetical protein